MTTKAQQQAAILRTAAGINRRAVADAEKATDPWEKLQVSHRDYLIDLAEAQESGAAALESPAAIVIDEHDRKDGFADALERSGVRTVDAESPAAPSSLRVEQATKVTTERIRDWHEGKCSFDDVTQARLAEHDAVRQDAAPSPLDAQRYADYASVCELPLVAAQADGKRTLGQCVEVAVEKVAKMEREAGQRDAAPSQGTCATCQHFGGDMECFSQEIADCNSRGFVVPSPQFGCTLHQPLAQKGPS